LVLFEEALFLKLLGEISHDVADGVGNGVVVSGGTMVEATKMQPLVGHIAGDFGS
jgi:hypothetical protein